MKTFNLSLGTILSILLLSAQASAGVALISSKTEVIEVTNPTQAFRCSPGDGGFIWTTVVLEPFSIPTEFGYNFRHTDGISFSRSNKGGGAVPCEEAMKPIEEEIKKQGGKLKVTATKNLTRSAYPGNGCQLFITEELDISVGSQGFSAINSFFVTELPVSSVFDCRDLIPDKI